MNNRLVLLSLILISVITMSSNGNAKNYETIELPAPQKTGGMPLMEALNARQSQREFSEKELSTQMLSNLLWAANGINREKSKKRTAPSAMNRQEIDIYVAMKQGLFLYDGIQNILKPVLDKDIRELTGKQDFVANAPVNLIFVADFTKMGDSGLEDKIFYSATDTGFISQNVYLFCASQGLATVVRGWVDKEKLALEMELRQDQMIVLAQTVGYPIE